MTRAWHPDPDGSIHLVHIGHDIYLASGTMIPPLMRIHPDGRRTRFDWGWLELSVKDNPKVVIHCRQMTNDEMVEISTHLNEVRKDPVGATMKLLDDVIKSGEDVHLVGP